MSLNTYTRMIWMEEFTIRRIASIKSRMAWLPNDTFLTVGGAQFKDVEQLRQAKTFVMVSNWQIGFIGSDVAKYKPFYLPTFVQPA